MRLFIGPRTVAEGRVDLRRRPFNRLPKKILKALRSWELPALGKIVELHPPEEFPRVADVGGGTGRMAVVLRELGYKVTLIEPVRHRTRGWRRLKNGKYRAVTRLLRGPSLEGIRVRRRKFLVRDALDYDLLVAVRPCGASQKLVRAAKYRPLVLLPCTEYCTVWPGKSGAVANIERCFRDLGVGFRRQGRDLFWTGESRKNAYVRAA